MYHQWHWTILPWRFRFEGSAQFETHGTYLHSINPSGTWGKLSGQNPSIKTDFWTHGKQSPETFIRFMIHDINDHVLIGLSSGTNQPQDEFTLLKITGGTFYWCWKDSEVQEVAIPISVQADEPYDVLISVDKCVLYRAGLPASTNLLGERNHELALKTIVSSEKSGTLSISLLTGRIYS